MQESLGQEKLPVRGGEAGTRTTKHTKIRNETCEDKDLSLKPSAFEP